MTPHSELPWKVSEDKNFIKDSEDNYVAVCANAAFIVRACNNYEKLVEITKRFLKSYQVMREVTPMPETNLEKEAKQAIQSAEEE